MVCDWWECEHYENCKSRCFYSGAKYPPCACCYQFDMCSVCTRYVECADLVTKFLPQMFRRLVREIRLGENTEHTEQIMRKNTLHGRKRR